ncbi:MAG: DUF4959 domain-containing protein [Bacteroidota bacterium]|nr:DUF4959 domain-containing protein [Bacteroidota bacterium]
MNKLTFLLALALAGFFIGSCDSSDIKEDTTAPGKLSVQSVTPTSGGGIIHYNLPADNDILFVRADYINAQGDEVYRVSSKENDSIEISGLIDTSPVTVNLSVFDTSQNQSEVVSVDFSPNRSFIFDVLESLEITSDLGGVRVNWTNDEEKTVFIYVSIRASDGEEEIRILSSSNQNGARFVRGLAAEEQNFSIKVEDFDGNSTPDTDFGNYTPLFEEKIDKTSWRLVSNLSVNGDAWEGQTVNFWDDIVDTVSTNSDNSYFIIYRSLNGGVLRWPLDIVIDLNKTVKINRFKVWQRAFWYNGPANTAYYYQAENLRSFDIYVSNDKVEWQLLGNFDIGDPSDGSGNIPDEKIDEAAQGHDFNLEEVSPEFRFFKFSITSNYGSDTYVHGSEISLFGVDNL